MATDEHGNQVTGSPEAVSKYDQAIDHLVRFRPEVVDLAVGLVETDRDFAMGQALLGYLHLMSTDQADVEVAASLALRLAELAANDRERAHAAALGAWAGGEWSGAARVLDDLLVHWPADLLALQVGHQLDFFTGDAANLRDRVARSLPAFDPAHPHQGYVTGMFAFGLEESGHYERSEAAGLAAVDRNPDDVWATHAVAHTYEMEGRVDAGIRYMEERVDEWGEDNLFTVHLWWHLALYCLEAGATERALEIYDARIHHAESAPVSLELLDASALLWRLRLDGVDVGSRFHTLATAWAAWDSDVPWYVFNDLHAVVADCGAGDVTGATERIERLERFVEGGGGGSNVAMTAEVGLPACRAIVAFTEERYDDVITDTERLVHIAHRFGGSHAQRDLIVRTLTDAAIGTGRLDLARALLAERLSMRPSSVYGLGRLSEILRITGPEVEAVRLADEAVADRNRFAAAFAQASSMT